ncbi:uncharacterized protein N7511_011211 [Penicillium nucicola]|uniref:uncharacterized protein n=1 Tax=Penicillium nucicola TaxID=1850975 RepID=UPI0025450A91|nr:uncharacterized protein N7511_011211 [Penicillium nucicola]KAJ5742810.1 hypothetical protein N7511_011211 [Penicillium nucicola]
MNNVRTRCKSLDAGEGGDSTVSTSRNAKRDHEGVSIEPKPKRTQRGKYALRACGQCKRRKIKCDGNTPCKYCVRRDCECQREGTDMRGKWRQPDITSLHRRFDTTNLVFSDPSKTTADSESRAKNPNSRMDQVDGQLRNLGSSSILQTTRHQNQEHLPDETATGSKRPLQNSTTSPTVATFSGETSLTHHLTVVEGRLEQMGVRYTGVRSTSPNQPFASRLTPSPGESSDFKPLDHTQGYMYQLLDPHGVVPDRKQWDQLMHTFCDEVHVLVPFLHLPSLWETYSKLWENSGASKLSPYHRHAESRFTMAHILLCLANGKCVRSSHVKGPKKDYSAGWSFYRAARDIFGDLLDAFSECSNQILLLQTILLMVVYLFRIDAHGSAEKLLALSISHSHYIGIQRYQVVEKLDIFESEMARRFWWCVYLMDRRLAIETGRPFLIQDVNVDIGLPRTVSDEWLSSCRGTSHLIRADDGAIERSHTTVPYLIAMTSYSKVIGKVWEALYGASTAHSSPSLFLNEYLELLIMQSQKDLQPEFSYDPRQPGCFSSNGLAWWQIKQQLIMRTRWASLYLLIRKPMLQQIGSSHSLEASENEVICMRLVRGIIDDFQNVPEDHNPKYTFPFLHYLASATIIALGLIMKQPSFRQNYGEMTLETARSLKIHCHKTWVSGKMARAVWKLNRMAEATLNPSFCSPEDQDDNHRMPSSHLSSQSYQSLGSLEHTRDYSAPSEQPVLRTPNAEMEIPASHRGTSQLEIGGQSLPGLLVYPNLSEGSSKPTQPLDLELDDVTTNNFDVEENQKALHASSGFQRAVSSNEGDTAQGFRKGETDQFHTHNMDLAFQAKGPNAVTGLYAQELEPFVPDPSVWLPGEMIDGGMEWLQTLFANDPDTHISFDCT